MGMAVTEAALAPSLPNTLNCRFSDGAVRLRHISADHLLVPCDGKERYAFSMKQPID